MVSSSSSQLLDLYDQASRYRLLEKSPDRLLVSMKNNKLSLETRGIFSWVKRVIFGRADKEYNFVKNLTKFQELIDGSLVDLHTKKIDAENVKKIEKMISIYNSLILGKKEKSPTTRLDQYVRRLGFNFIGEKPKVFSPLRVISKMPESSTDPAFNFIRAIFRESTKRTPAADEVLTCSMQLLLQSSPQLKSVSESYKKLQDRVEALTLFQSTDPAFLHAQEVLTGMSQKAETDIDTEKWVADLDSAHQSLNSVVGVTFEKAAQEINELETKFKDLQEAVARQNESANKMKYPKLMEALKQEGVNEVKELIRGHDENGLRTIGDKINQFKSEISHATETLGKFTDDLNVYRSLRQTLIDRWNFFKEHKNGVTAKKVSDAWIQTIKSAIGTLKKNGVDAKDEVMRLLNEMTEEKFPLAVKAELENQQSALEQELQSKVISYKPAQTGLLGGVIKKIVGEDPGVAKARVEAAADYFYGLAKLMAEVDKALAWNKWLCNALGKDASQTEEVFQKVILLNSELNNTKNLPPEKLNELFDNYKKIAKKNVELQADLETRTPPTPFLDVMQRNFASLAMLQEEIEILTPLTQAEKADAHATGEHYRTKNFCRTLLGNISQVQGEQVNLLEDELHRKKELLDATVPMLWPTWCPDSPKRTITAEAFMQMNLQNKMRYITTVMNKD